MAVASRDTSTTEPSPVRRPPEQRGGDAEGERHAAVAVAEGAPLRDRVVALGRGEHVADAAPGPERRGVVAGQPGVGAADAVAVAPGVDEPRVALPDLVGAEAEPLEGVGPEAGEQHVGRRRAGGGGSRCPASVRRSRAIDRLPRLARATDRLTPAAVGADALGGEAPVGVALGPVDADDVGAPVGEERAGDGHEHPLGQLDDPDARRTPASSSATALLHQSAAVDLGRLAARDGVDELDRLRHLVGGQPRLGVGDRPRRPSAGPPGRPAR